MYVPFDFYLSHKNTTKHFPHTLSLSLPSTFSILFPLSSPVWLVLSSLSFFAYYASFNVWEHTKATRIYLFNPIANYWRTCLLVAMFAQVLFVCWRWNFKCICSFNAIRFSSWFCVLVVVVDVVVIVVVAFDFVFEPLSCSHFDWWPYWLSYCRLSQISNSNEVDN